MGKRKVIWKAVGERIGKWVSWASDGSFVLFRPHVGGLAISFDTEDLAWVTPDTAPELERRLKKAFEILEGKE
jgi:hypothetical protein